MMGKIATDIVTGFSGIVTAICQSITGPDEYQLSPKVNDKGEWQEPRWFPIQRLSFTEVGE